MQVSADGTILANPSAQPVWCTLWENGKPAETLVVQPGQTINTASLPTGNK
jgi:hypothetical protein